MWGNKKLSNGPTSSYVKRFIEELHTRAYMITKRRCVWNKTFLLGHIVLYCFVFMHMHCIVSAYVICSQTQAMKSDITVKGYWCNDIYYSDEIWIWNQFTKWNRIRLCLHFQSVWANLKAEAKAKICLMFVFFFTRCEVVIKTLSHRERTNLNRKAIPFCGSFRSHRRRFLRYNLLGILLALNLVVPCGHFLVLL